MERKIILNLMIAIW